MSNWSTEWVIDIDGLHLFSKLNVLREVEHEETNNPIDFKCMYCL